MDNQTTPPMPYLVTYRDFKGRQQARSFAHSETKARGAVIRRADCAQLLKVEPITEAEHARRQAALKQEDNRIYNAKEASRP